MPSILSNASLQINDVAITIKANTLSFSPGSGEVSVQGASRGGNVVPISSVDVESQIGMVKAEIPATIEEINLINGFKRSPGSLTVVISGRDKDGNTLSANMTQAEIVNEIEVSLQNEGGFEIELKGAPMEIV